MTRKAYLTIDDSPTKETDNLVDFLVARDIPATLFAIGSSYKDMHVECEGMEQNPAPIVRAIEKGMVIGNHTYSHRRSSELSFKEVVEEIEKNERLIDKLYREAGKTRPFKVLRFPHLDRGCGGWIVDYDAAGQYGGHLKNLFAEGLNIDLTPPSAEQIEKKVKIQDYLRQEGFVTDIYKGVTFPWYKETEMADAYDLLGTFSTADWMANPDFISYARERGWPYPTLEALKSKIDMDSDLKDEESAHIIIAHDHNKLVDTTCALVTHMQDSGIEFLDVTSNAR